MREGNVKTPEEFSVEVMAFVAGVLLAVLGAGSALAVDSSANIEHIDACFVHPPVDIAASIGAYDCGFVVVPEDRAQPEGAKVRLGFVRIPARTDTPAAPFFMLSGGPGNTLLNPVTFALLSDTMLGPLLEGRDIVILEQRGAEHSRPALDCPLFHRLSWTANRLGLDRDEALYLSRQVFRDCVDQARAHGIDLAQYNSVVIDSDIDLARQALGYEKMVYYGASYGSQLGQHIMRDYPDRLEAVVLDGASALSPRGRRERDRLQRIRELKTTVATRV